MKLYIKEVKYNLWQEFPAYGFNFDGYDDSIVDTTGWITEDEKTTDTSLMVLSKLVRISGLLVKRDTWNMINSM